MSMVTEKLNFKKILVLGLLLMSILMGTAAFAL